MKKVFTAALTLALASVLSISALAVTNNGGNTSADVNGVYQAGSEAPETISADIVWDDMNFTYTEGKKTWNPEKHIYEQEAGAWSDENKSITVTNHSNLEVIVKLSFNGEGDITARCEDETHLLSSAKGTAVENAPITKFEMSIIGGTMTKSGKIGTLTVSIHKKTAIVEHFGLKDAMESQNQISIDADILMAGYLQSRNGEKTSLYLNGKTITAKCDDMYSRAFLGAAGRGTVFNISNGTVCAKNSGAIALYIGSNARMNVENCTIVAADEKATAIRIGDGASAILNNCTIDGDIVFADEDADGVYGSSISLSGNIVFNGKFVNGEKGSITCSLGTYNFDPTQYLFSDTYKVTENADGTWTVSRS